MSVYKAAADPITRPVEANAEVADLLGMELLKHVPALPRAILDRMLRRYNLVQVFRFLARLAPLFVEKKVRDALR